MERAKLVMRRAMGRLNIAYKQAQSNHMLFLVLFAILLFTGLYVLSKVSAPWAWSERLLVALGVRRRLDRTDTTLLSLPSQIYRIGKALVGGR
jgi:hypothetical protein